VPVRSLAFSRDDRFIVSLAWKVIGGEVFVWDAVSGKLLHRHVDSKTPQQVAFSPDGKQLALTDRDGVTVWDVSAGALPPNLQATPRYRLYGRARMSNALSFSADGKRLAVNGIDQAVRLWDLTTGEEVLTMRPHGALVSAVAFSPTGELLATGGSDMLVKVWDGRARRNRPVSR
jgi:WD40 repeat protein